MLFNSVEYLIFLPIVFLLYWFVFKKRNIQNLFILVASYVFYGWWNWRFLILIFFTSLCSYISGLLIEKYRDNTISGTQKSVAWGVSLVNILINLGILGVYKYYDFFAANVVDLLQMCHIQANISSLELILPVGISFYTFQALGYSIDVYRGKTKATHDPVQFFAFLSFFPQLVAGPIESSTNLLPQFAKDRQFSYDQASDGMRQILWGLFKKMVIADNCAMVVNTVFADYQEDSGLMLIIAGIFFTFQIYGDFSGYSDIAIGSAKLFGFRLIRNFHTPYFSRNMAEFWRRWHISLMKWFTEYVYFPLGGSRCSKTKHIRNIIIVFLVSGLWHGANWTFVLWGLYNGILVAICAFTCAKRKDIVAEGKILPSLKELGMMWLTFFFAIIGWILFRAQTITDFFAYMGDIVTNWGIEMHDIERCRNLMYYIIAMTLIEWFTRSRDHAMSIPERFLTARWCPVRYAWYLFLFIFILMNCGIQGQFIYFQF